MKDFESIAIRHINGNLEILDQQQLPNKEIWIKISDYQQMVAAIKALKIRGAPLIGVAAALSLAKFAEAGCTENEFIQAAQHLRNARPTAINLMWAIDSMKAFKEDFDPKKIIQKAQLLYEEDIQLCQNIAEHGAQFIEDGDNVLTHCNTGGLATVGIGTALGIIRYAHESGKNFHVWVDESRPLLQGGRLTTWELDKLNIPHTLICDNMAAPLMQQRKINKALVGADRIATNGDFANKIGTYGVATQCHFHEIPFYVAAPYSTVDKHCRTGDDIPIENRAMHEVKGVEGAFGSVQWAPVDSQVYNPAFDVTPHQLVTAWILDHAVLDQNQVASGALVD